MDDKVRNVIEKLKNHAAAAGTAAQSAAREVCRKTSDTIEITKLNVKIFDLNSEVSVCFRKLGELMYSTYSGAATTYDSFDSVLSEIDDKKSEIDALRSRIRELKDETQCPQCGASLSRSDSFCRKCGFKKS